MKLNEPIPMLETWKHSRPGKLMTRVLPDEMNDHLAYGFTFILALIPVAIVYYLAGERWALVTLVACVPLGIILTFLNIAAHEPSYSSLTPAERRGARELQRRRKERTQTKQ